MARGTFLPSIWTSNEKFTNSALPLILRQGSSSALCAQLREIRRTGERLKDLPGAVRRWRGLASPWVCYRSIGSRCLPA